MLIVVGDQSLMAEKDGVLTYLVWLDPDLNCVIHDPLDSHQNPHLCDENSVELGVRDVSCIRREEGETNQATVERI